MNASTKSPMTFSRHLNVDGTFNLRDVGHYATRDGRVMLNGDPLRVDYGGETFADEADDELQLGNGPPHRPQGAGDDDLLVVEQPGKLVVDAEPAHLVETSQRRDALEPNRNVRRVGLRSPKASVNA
jgi:hypothetical protein